MAYPPGEVTVGRDAIRALWEQVLAKAPTLRARGAAAHAGQRRHRPHLHDRRATAPASGRRSRAARPTAPGCGCSTSRRSARRCSGERPGGGQGPDRAGAARTRRGARGLRLDPADARQGARHPGRQRPAATCSAARSTTRAWPGSGSRPSSCSTSPRATRRPRRAGRAARARDPTGRRGMVRRPGGRGRAAANGELPARARPRRAAQGRGRPRVRRRRARRRRQRGAHRRRARRRAGAARCTRSRRSSSCTTERRPSSSGAQQARIVRANQVVRIPAGVPHRWVATGAAAARGRRARRRPDRHLPGVNGLNPTARPLRGPAMRHAQAIELCHLTCAARASSPEPDISMQPDTVAVIPRHQQRTPAPPARANSPSPRVGCSLPDDTRARRRRQS